MMTIMFRVSDDFEVTMMVWWGRRGSTTVSRTFVRIGIGIKLYMFLRRWRWRRLVMTVVLWVCNKLEVSVMLRWGRRSAAT